MAEENEMVSEGTSFEEETEVVEIVETKRSVSDDVE